MSKSIAVTFGVCLFVMGATAQEVYVDNVVIVLDASGSMNDSMRGTDQRKIAAARRAIKEVMKTIPQTTQVGVLVFGGAARDWVYPLGPRDDDRLYRAIDSLSAGGGTPLGEYMKRGADRLLKAREAQYGYGSYRLLVVTDGEATDQPQVDAYTPDIIARGIVADVIGVDMADDHTLATKVHSYRRANDPAALKRAIQEVFAEVGKTGDGRSVEDGFEELAGLPDGTAMAVISALTSSGNHPIGKRPGNGVVDEDTQAGDHGATRQAAQHKPVADRDGKSGFPWMFLVIGVVTVAVFLAKSK